MAGSRLAFACEGSASWVGSCCDLLEVLGEPGERIPGRRREGTALGSRPDFSCARSGSWGVLGVSGG